MRVLHGSLDANLIAEAGSKRLLTPRKTVDDVLAACVRHALYCERSLRRDRLWSASYALHQMRMGLMDAFGMTHGGVRGWISFEADADSRLQDLLAATVSNHTASSLGESLLGLIDVLERHSGAFTDGQAELVEGGRAVLSRLRLRVLAEN
jgi:hypothetical protein